MSYVYVDKSDKSAHIIQNMSSYSQKKFAVRSFKGLLGIRHDDPNREVLANKCLAEPRRTEDNLIEFFCEENQKAYSPVDLLSLILNHIIAQIKSNTGKEEIDYYTFTVPAYFTQRQRREFEKVIEKCNIRREQYCIIYEPIAAAICSGIENVITSSTFLVYDLGGGTFDVSIVRIENDRMSVIHTDGDNLIGGDLFDMIVMDWVEKECLEQFGRSILPPKESRRYSTSRSKLIQNCQVWKEQVWNSDGIDIYPSAFNNHAFKESEDEATLRITPSILEKLLEPYLKTTIDVIERAISTAGLTKQDISNVLLVGGSTRLPQIKNLLQTYFEDAIRIRENVNPDECVAIGACHFCTAWHENRDQPVIKFNDRCITFDEVTRYDIGIGGGDDSYHILIPRNTPMNGIRYRQRLRKSSDNVEEQGIHVYEGNREKASDNIQVGTVKWSGFPRYPAKYVYFDFYLSVDRDGYIYADVEDVRTRAKYVDHKRVHSPVCC